VNVTVAQFIEKLRVMPQNVPLQIFTDYGLSDPSEPKLETVCRYRLASGTFGNGEREFPEWERPHQAPVDENVEVVPGSEKQIVTI
jgi:hypothetical protein